MSMIVTLDVRPMLAKGQEPFAAIMQAADALGPDQTLRLIAPFRPVPLIGVLRQRGLRGQRQDQQAAGLRQQCAARQGAVGSG